MATMIGDAGGIAVAPESTYGTAIVVGSAVWQTPFSASLGVRKSVINPGHLGIAGYTYRKYSPGYSDGDIVVGHHRERTVIGGLLGALGTLATQTYNFGTGVAPTNANGLTVYVDTGGHTMQYPGQILTKLRWELAVGQAVKMTAEFLGQPGVKTTAATVSQPTQANIQMDSNLATFTLGTATICILGATIEVSQPVSGSDRVCLGGSTIKQPVWAGRPTITASLQCELSSDTGNDTVSQLDDYLTGVSIGDLVIDDWTLASCWMTGDPPSLQSGITTFPINVEAATLALITTT
jgi:hypothetical protein